MGATDQKQLLNTNIIITDNYLYNKFMTEFYLSAGIILPQAKVLCYIITRGMQWLKHFLRIVYRLIDRFRLYNIVQR